MVYKKEISHIAIMRVAVIATLMFAFFFVSSSVEAAQFVQSPQASGDDCFENDANVGYNCSSDFWVESGGTAAGRINTGVRFPNVTIAQGTTIDSATVSVKTNATGGQRMDGVIWGHAHDNSPLGDVTALPTTSASVSWSSGTVSSNTRITSGDIKTVIQEIVDRGGFVSGNAISLIIKGRDGSNYNLFGWSYDTSATAADDPILTINFTIPPPDATTQDASDLAQTGATGNGTITDLKGVDGTNRGFVWGETSLGDPGDVAPGSTSYDDFVTESGTFIEEAFTGDIDGLTESTDYFYRAYVETAEGFGYGNEVAFTSSDPPPGGLAVTMPQLMIAAIIVFVVVGLIIQLKAPVFRPEVSLVIGVVGIISIVVMIGIAG
jgi:hypothetical protein